MSTVPVIAKSPATIGQPPSAAQSYAKQKRSYDAAIKLNAGLDELNWAFFDIPLHMPQDMASSDGLGKACAALDAISATLSADPEIEQDQRPIVQFVLDRLSDRWEELASAYRGFKPATQASVKALVSEYQTKTEAIEASVGPGLCRHGTPAQQEKAIELQTKIAAVEQAINDTPSADRVQNLYQTIGRHVSAAILFVLFCWAIVPLYTPFAAIMDAVDSGRMAALSKKIEALRNELASLDADRARQEKQCQDQWLLTPARGPSLATDSFTGTTTKG